MLEKEPTPTIKDLIYSCIPLLFPKYVIESIFKTPAHPYFMKNQNLEVVYSLPEPIKFNFENEEDTREEKSGELSSDDKAENIFSFPLKKQIKKYSVQIEASNQVLMDRMIREEIQQQGRMSRKMSLDDDEVCLCTSDIYTKSNCFWKNREISQITTKKLDTTPINQIKKLKILNECPMAGYNLFKITTESKEVTDLAIRSIDLPSWFCNALWISMVNAGHELPKRKEFEFEIEGEILKRSQFLGNWELRYATVSQKTGLRCGKKKGESATLKIKETNELWSRLEIIEFEGVKYVILKIWHMMFKYEFGVPLIECLAWSKAFSTLVK